MKTYILVDNALRQPYMLNQREYDLLPEFKKSLYKELI